MRSSNVQEQRIEKFSPPDRPLGLCVYNIVLEVLFSTKKYWYVVFIFFHEIENLIWYSLEAPQWHFIWLDMMFHVNCLHNKPWHSMYRWLTWNVKPYFQKKRWNVNPYFLRKNLKILLDCKTYFLPHCAWCFKVNTLSDNHSCSRWNFGRVEMKCQALFSDW